MIRKIIKIERAKRQRLIKNILWKKGPEKSLINGLCNNSGGRNNHGKITVLHRGGGVKRLCRIIAPLDTFQKSLTSNSSVINNQMGPKSTNELSTLPSRTLTIERFEYDPNRTAYLALITGHSNNTTTTLRTLRTLRTSKNVLNSLNHSETQSLTTNIDKFYTIASTEMITAAKIGNSNHKFDYESNNKNQGNSISSDLISLLPQELGTIPVGKLIYNLNDRYIKSAGTSGRLLKKSESDALIRMPSGEFKSFPLHFKALLGTVSNAEHKNEIIGKAGVNRLRGIRPHVRGIAMNPVDHPHGGSNDKIGITPWGKPSKGYKTVRRPRVKRSS